MGETLSKLGSWAAKVALPWAKSNYHLVLAGIAATVILTIAIKIYHAGGLACESSEKDKTIYAMQLQMADQAKEIARSNALAAGLQQRLEDLQGDYDLTVGELDHEISSKPVYHACVVPVDGVRLINRTIQAGASRH